ncbi:MAG: TlpA family protein disulfide reductase [Acidobacteria bacterium]|nr:TlpA family protein disulfide reductase [Acidobacteriota bacterium]
MKRFVLVVAVIAAASGCSKKELPSVDTAPPPAVDTDASAGMADTTVTAVATTGTKEAEVAAKLAAYSAPRLDGTPYVVGEQKGKALLLNVWATWCAPCRYEIPELKAMQAELGPKGLEVVGISVDEKPDNERAVREFVAEKSIEYPIVLDPEGKILLLLESSTVPTTVLLDKSGTVVWYSVGIVQSNDPALTEALGKALAQ